jgi:N4-gp56 family major capsid protein|tara:strand:- start:40 stop:978 length:939 start_codon:yes stop_codon:yes gene_type:complete
MALGTNHVTNTTAATFIPEIWSDEIIAAYEKSLVLANLVNRMPMTGKKGDVVHIPKPTRGDASAKAASTQVTLIAATESEVQVAIDKHFEYSRLIEDITDVQALTSLRQFYTSDAGYALAKQADTDLFTLTKSFGDSDGADYVHSNSFYMDTSTNLTAYAVDTVAAADVFTDDGFREAIKELDDNDVPMDQRFLVVPPSVVQTIRGITRYNSADFVSGQPTVNGNIGSLYGIDIFVSTNCPVVETASANSAGGELKAGILGHRDAMVFAEQMGVRTQTQYKQEYLGDLFTADTLYGVKVLRPESALTLVFNS